MISPEKCLFLISSDIIMTFVTKSVADQYGKISSSKYGNKFKVYSQIKIRYLTNTMCHFHLRNIFNEFNILNDSKIIKFKK